MAKEIKARTSTIIAPTTAADIKFIALFEKKTMAEIIDDVLLSYIEKWKKDNPTIKFPGDK